MCNIFHVYVNYANVLKGLQFPTPTRSDVKCLGIIFTEYLNWNAHISHLFNIISTIVGILSRLKYVLSKNINDNTYETHWSKIELFQKKAVRILTNSDFRSFFFGGVK